MTAPTTPRPLPGLTDLVARQREAADAQVETYRLSLSLTDTFRHELEAPAHETACAHMAPGCPCDDNETTPEVTA
jgi:hypothetical protein